MGGQKKDKLKRLLDTVPPGHVIDARTLRSRGIPRQLAHRYIASGWLSSPAHGLYRRTPAPEGSIDWRVAVRSLQHLMDYDSVVGGRTALELQGLGHYVRLGAEPTIHLYGERHPTWLARLSGSADFRLHGTRLFEAGPVEDTMADTPAGAVRCSSPERAVLELLDELPGMEDFHVADTIFESLATARPRRLSGLLTRCRSVKVKRLFFVFADRHGHAWRRHLSPDAFELGSGDRALVAGGRLHPTYRITVPEPFVRDVSEHADDA